MKIQLKNIKQNKIIIFDVEYDQNLLVQLATLILSKVEPNIFELQESINIYVKPNRSLNNFFIKYTNITDEFLCDNGVDLTVAKQLVDEVVFNSSLDDMLIVSHGIKSDLQLLQSNGIDLIKIPNQYCTYQASKRLLKRNEHLTLKDVAAEGKY